ncbi:PGF-pre-PGF domain-containing protein [Salinigranum halophilum]|uniref:PGF-pre-PGF domain-containing protein n=1 Tax=Salinigranum halophilum TaxID=2565931 RepID=UPI0010A8E94E|nr:PGF-pre-PGF domain-containing protein [Salinigranum halophilum]
MVDESSRQLFVIAVSVLVVTGMIPAVTAGAFAPEQTEPRAAISGPDFVDASADVEVWNRAPFPLRTNPERNADTVIKNVDPFVEVTEYDAGRVRLNKDKVAVYDDEAEIQLQFQSGLGYQTSSFQGQDVQLVAAHIEEDTEAARDLFASRSTLTTDSALDLLTRDNVNDNVHFDLVEDYGTLDGNGEIVETYDLGDEDRGAGFYVFFLVQDYQGSNSWGVTDRGFEESSGDLNIENKSRVLGVDTATVHQQPAEASPGSNTYAAGEDITFDVDARQNDGDVTHAIVVYNRQNFENKDVTLTVDGDLDSLSANDVTIEREIADVNGVATISGSPNVFGLGDIQDGRSSGLISGGQLIDFVAEQANSDAPLDETTDDAVTLDASVTVIDGDDTGQVTVETLENWSTGRYGYLYVATGENSQEITTTRGELTITPEQSQGGNMDNGRFALSRVSDDVSDFSIDFGPGASGEVRVSQQSSPGQDVPAVNGPDPIYLDIEVSQELQNRESTIEATVTKSRLGDLDPDEVSLWHFTDGEWTELETEIASENATHVTYTATTDGFSPFAFAESAAADEREDSDDDGMAGGGELPTDEPTPEPTSTEAAPTETAAPETAAPETAEPTAEPAQTDMATAQPEQTATPTTTDTQFPGLGVTVTLVAFVFAVLFGLRRRQR